ncbi:hypothetical protein E2C01_017369 [Portunus trituberculatus]|uniref:Uncharacterized protein n=1 Tax=Portunus trituberculatus TaxID=210409 RepID=A0A5B7DTA0_PORTR|nr:hypothetical protein [Portunus trituberculatus]
MWHHLECDVVRVSGNSVEGLASRAAPVALLEGAGTLTFDGTTLNEDCAGLMGWHRSSSRLYSEPDGSGADTLTWGTQLLLSCHLVLE